MNSDHLFIKKNDVATESIAAFKVIKFVSNSFKNLPITFKNNDVRKGMRTTPKIKIPKTTP